MKQTITAIVLCLLAGYSIAQSRLSLENVYNISLRNSGAIKEGDQVKGYYLFYQSDKVDRKTNEYALQILDQNLNKVKDIKFQDSKKVTLLEAAYNGSSLGFLFRNDDTKMLDMKIYDMNGKLQASFSNEIDKKAERRLTMSYKVLNDDESNNKNMFDLQTAGFVNLYPVKEDGHFGYHLEFYMTNKKQFSYTSDDEEKYALATYLGATDSLLLLDVTKKQGGDISSHIVGINIYTHKKEFDITNKGNEEPFVAINMTTQKETGNILIMGSYFEKGANIVKDASQGIGVYVYSGNGKLVSKTLNSWTGELSKFLNVSSNGKIEDIGYLYFHDIVQTADGKTFAVAEGYKRVADALGIGLNALRMASGTGVSAGGNTKMKVTDMVLLELNPAYKITKATVYNKNANIYRTLAADLNSQHSLAMLMKADDAFDYQFTLTNSDHSSFSFCYKDYERSKDYKGQVFHAIRYTGSGFSTDQVNLVTKATIMSISPAKQGSVMVMEYFKKDKKLDMRLEKLN
jgi:hypothetical protein